jgi:heavy metal sensor kinase
MNHRSLAVHLAAWYTLLLSAAFGLVGAVTFYGLQHYLLSTLRDVVTHRSEQVEQILREAHSVPQDAEIVHEVQTRLTPELNNRFIRIIRPPAKMIYVSGPPSDMSFDPAKVLVSIARDNPSGAVGTWLERDSHVMVHSDMVQTANGRYTVEAGISTAPMEAVLERLRNLLFKLLPVLIAFAAGGAYFLVQRALRPVDRIARTAEQMSLQSLDLRLPVVPTGDALERLSISMNSMLNRLRDSVQSSRRFLADASHELRTPLTVIKGELQEVVGDRELVSDVLRERIGSVLEEVGRLEHLVSGLLVLSRLDAGEMPRERVDVDLAELLRTTADQMRLVAEDRGVAIDASALRHAVVRGDSARLKQVAVNLLDNAIRFTPTGGTVSLTTAHTDHGVSLEVSDTGIGIPSAALGQVFERFYRVDEARSRDDGGAGLGLSIVKSICAMHGARIEVQSSLGIGSTFCVKFGRLSSTEADATRPSCTKHSHDRLAKAVKSESGVISEAVTGTRVREPLTDETVRRFAHDRS